jgi:hypothetical protein
MASASYAIHVTSSMIHSLVFDQISLSLLVRFKPSEKCYKYYNVPAVKAQMLRNANSVGGYFNSHIKDVFESDTIGETHYFDMYQRITDSMVPIKIIKIDWIRLAGNGLLPVFPR